MSMWVYKHDVQMVRRVSNIADFFIQAYGRQEAGKENSGESVKVQVWVSKCSEWSNF